MIHPDQYREDREGIQGIGPLGQFTSGAEVERWDEMREKAAIAPQDANVVLGYADVTGHLVERLTPSGATAVRALLESPGWKERHPGGKVEVIDCADDGVIAEVLATSMREDYQTKPGGA